MLSREASTAMWRGEAMEDSRTPVRGGERGRGRIEDSYSSLQIDQPCSHRFSRLSERRFFGNVFSISHLPRVFSTCIDRTGVQNWEPKANQTQHCANNLSPQVVANTCSHETRVHTVYRAETMMVQYHILTLSVMQQHSRGFSGRRTSSGSTRHRIFCTCKIVRP